MPKFDVVTFGESMLRLNPPGCQRLEQASLLEIQVGGSESNTAAALTVLGRNTAWWSRLPRNPIGRRIESEIRIRGVDTSGVIWEEGRAGVYFLEFGVKPRPHEITYDRADSAASHLTPDDVDLEILRSARHLHLTGITPALSPSCAQGVLAAVREAKGLGMTVSFDVNYRRKLWSVESAREMLVTLFPFVDLLITAATDSADVLGVSGDPQGIAGRLRQHYRIPCVVVTSGSHGATSYSDSGVVTVNALDSEEVDRVGSGDAFDAGVIDGFLDGDLERGLRYGCAMAAIKRTIHGDMLRCTRGEIESVLSSAALTIRR